MMKLKNVLRGIAAAFFLFSILPANAQRYQKKAPEQSNTEKSDTTEKMNLRDRLVFGGNFVAGFGTSTYVDISPLVGYRCTPKLIVGVGITYIYLNYALIDPTTGVEVAREKFHIYGGRIFSQYDLFSNALSHGDKIFVAGEYEGLNVPYQSFYYPYDISRRWIGNPFVGGGYRSSLGGRAFANITVLYNLNYVNNWKYSQIVYSSPLKVSIGIMF
jgi:hypothetical protein